MMNGIDTTKTARSALWSLLENGGLALISMGSLIIYTHVLSTSEFGLFSIVLALVELLQVVVSMLFHDALVQRSDATEQHFDTAFSFSVALGIALFLLCCLFSPLFAILVKNPAAALVLCSMALCLPASSFSATIVARQRRELSFRPLAIRSLVGRFAGAFAGILLVVLGAGVWGLVAQQVLIQLVGSLLLWHTSSERPKLRFSVRELKELIAFGMYAVGTLFLNFAVKRLFTVLTGLFLGVTAAGYLNLSFRALDVFWAISATAVTQVALPMLSGLQSDPSRLRRTFQIATGFVCTALYPMFVGLSITAPEIVSVLFGAKWLPSAPYITALGLLVIVQAPRLMVTPMLTALGRPRDLMIGKAVELAFVVAAIFLSHVPSIGWAVGIWIARELVSFPILLRMAKSAMKLGFIDQFRGVAVPLVSSVLMALAVFFLRRQLPSMLIPALRLGVLAATGAAVFVTVTSLLDRELARRVLRVALSAVGRQPGLSFGGTPQPGSAK